MDLLDDVRAAAEAAIRQASEKRRRLEAFAVNDIADAEEKARLHAEAEAALRDVRLIADLLIGAAISTAGDDRDRSLRQLDAELERLAPLVGQALDPDRPEGARANARNAIAAKARELLDAGKPDAQPPRRCFHWPIEFPEVFDRENPGFDALVSNPPFQGGKRSLASTAPTTVTISSSTLPKGSKGRCRPVCILLSARLARSCGRGGGFGLARHQHDCAGRYPRGRARRDGEVRHCDSRAVPSRKWPGTANLEVAHVWVHKGRWHDGFVLDDRPVKASRPT